MALGGPILRGVKMLFSATLLAVAMTVTASGQALRVEATGEDARNLIESVRLQSGVDIVYAHSLLEGRTVTCSYAGDSVLEALQCVLSELNLEPDQVGPRQFVVRVPLMAPETTTHRIAGRVMDQTTGEGIVGAHVFLPELGSGAVTGANGAFEIRGVGPGMHRVRVSFVGYATVRETVVVPSADLLLQLVPTEIGTDMLVVTGQSADREALASLPGVVALPVADLEQMPSSLDDQDLFQALEWLPGIERSGETVGGLAVRGSSPDQNLYLLEGAPVYHPSHAFSLISTFQTQTLTDVKFYRGSLPAEHGGMLSAVLDARLKDGTGDRPRASFALNALNARFLIETPMSSTSSFMISARRSYIDKLIGTVHPVEENGKRDTLRTGYYFYDWSAKVTFHPGDRSRISVAYYRGRDNLDLRLPFDLSLTFSDWLRPADLFFEVGHAWGNEILSAQYQHILSPSALLRFSAYESRYDAIERTFVQPTATSVVASDYVVSLKDLGFKFDLDYTSSVTNTFRAGIRVSELRFRSSLDAMLERSASLVKDVDESNSVQSLEMVGYVDELWRPSDRWQVNIGLRASTFRGASGVRLDPRLSIRLLVSSRVALRAGLGSQVQYLQRLRDRYSFLYDLVSSRWIPVGGSIVPATGRQVAVGAETEAARWLLVSAESFYRDANHVLLPRDEFQTKEGIDGPGIDVSALLGEHTPGRTRSYGLEITNQVTTGPWRALVTYTWSRSHTRAPELGEEAFRIGRYDVPRSLRTALSWSGRRWRYSASAIVRTGYPETVPVAQYAVGSPLDPPETFLHRPRINNGRLPAYARLDLFAEYGFRSGAARWRIKLHLYNVLNRRNVVGRQYEATDNGVSVVKRAGLPLLPLLEIQMDL